MDKPSRRRKAVTLGEADDRIRELEHENAQLREENDLVKSSNPPARTEAEIFASIAEQQRYRSNQLDVSTLLRQVQRASARPLELKFGGLFM
jgi:hypothetical protein